MTKAVIIVAGGKGLRMGGDVPKQFLVVEGQPILMHTIRRFYDYDASMQIIVVLPKEQTEYWLQLCREYAFDIEVSLAYGGTERFYSVMNGLAKVASDVQLVGVHDGVRPYVSTETICACFDEAERSGAAIPVTDVVETVRHMNADGSSHTVPRSEYKLVQTPQVFERKLLEEAYRQKFDPAFTDDASVVETYGHAVVLVAGNRENIKITTKADLK